MWTDKKINFEVHVKQYIRGKSLYMKRFRPEYPSDHTFCIFCRARVSEFKEDLQNLMYEPETESWICYHCFDLFAEKLELTDVTSEATAREALFDYTPLYFDT